MGQRNEFLLSDTAQIALAIKEIKDQAAYAAHRRNIHFMRVLGLVKAPCAKGDRARCSRGGIGNHKPDIADAGSVHDLRRMGIARGFRIHYDADVVLLPQGHSAGFVARDLCKSQTGEHRAKGLGLLRAGCGFHESHVFHRRGRREFGEGQFQTRLSAPGRIDEPDQCAMAIQRQITGAGARPIRRQIQPETAPSPCHQNGAQEGQKRQIAIARQHAKATRFEVEIHLDGRCIGKPDVENALGGNGPDAFRRWGEKISAPLHLIA